MITEETAIKIETAIDKLLAEYYNIEVYPY